MSKTDDWPSTAAGLIERCHQFGTVVQRSKNDDGSVLLRFIPREPLPEGAIVTRYVGAYLHQREHNERTTVRAFWRAFEANRDKIGTDFKWRAGPTVREVRDFATEQHYWEAYARLMVSEHSELGKRLAAEIDAEAAAMAEDPDGS